MIELIGFSVSFWLSKNVRGFKVPARQCNSYLFLNYCNSRRDEEKKQVTAFLSVDTFWIISYLDSPILSNASLC